MFVHQTWKESRLKLPNDIFEEGDDYVTLPPEFFDNLWQPDPYFLNSKIAGKLPNKIYLKPEKNLRNLKFVCGRRENLFFFIV